jgi:hypothetical protein
MDQNGTMNRFDWARLNHMQVGRFAEYFVKMELTLYGFEVYTTEVDDRCIDFVARRDDGAFYEVQVKSVRGFNYVFIPKEKFAIAPHRLLALVILHQDKEPEFYLVPMTAWSTRSKLFASRDYEGKKSRPEWGLNLSAVNQNELDQFRFERIVRTLVGR